MTEYFPKSTETATGWCKQCNRNTEHRVDGGRLGPCIDPQHPTPPPKPPTAEWLVIEQMTLERMKLLTALGDLMCFYNRITEPGMGGHGWTASDVLRLEEIRKLLMPYVRLVI